MAGGFIGSFPLGVKFHTFIFFSWMIWWDLDIGSKFYPCGVWDNNTWQANEEVVHYYPTNISRINYTVGGYTTLITSGHNQVIIRELSSGESILTPIILA